MRIIYICALIHGVLAGQAWAELLGGAASRDITPDVKAHEVPMAGYGARQGKPSEGVHDALRAKVLYVRDGDVEAAFIACDLRSISSQLKNAVVERLEGQGFTRDNVFMCASHNHSGPSFYPERFWQLQFGIFDPAILPPMTKAIADAVIEARDKAEPIRIGYAQTQVVGFTRNRRWGYDTAAREAAGEVPAVDPTLTVLRVDGVDGACKALMVHFATHPTILGADNMQLSAEWPGVLQRELESKFPGAVTLYANGAEGDQSPAGAQGVDAYEKVQDFGSRLAAKAAELAGAIEVKAAAALGITRVTPALPGFVFSEGAKRGPYAHLVSQAEEQLPRDAEIQVMRLGALALVGLPGEPICEVGWAVQERVRSVGFEQVVVVGLANDYIGYIVNEKEYAHGGYEVDMRSYYGPGLGAFMAEQAGSAANQLIEGN